MRFTGAGIAAWTFAVLVAAGACLGADSPAASAGPAAKDDEAGFVAIFNGKDLSGWEGNTDFWSVQDGAIVGQTPEPAKGSTYLFWRGGRPADLELRLEFQLANNNSGILFRSRDLGNFVAAGYQADFDSRNRHTGGFYGGSIKAQRGQRVVVAPDGKKEVGQTCTEEEFAKAFKKDDWNTYTIIAQGNHLTLKINGLVTAEITDNQRSKRDMSGLLALQLHAGPPMKVRFRNIRLKSFGTE